MITVYGIKTCSTVQKALKWLQDNGISAQLHDYRSAGVEATFLQQAEAAFGWQALVNKKSTTWRNLDQATKDGLSAANAQALLLANPTLIKRPIILQDNKALIGFDANQYAAAFGR